MPQDSDKMSHEALKKRLADWRDQTFPGFMGDAWPNTWQYKMQVMELYERCRNTEIVAEILGAGASDILGILPVDADWDDTLYALRSRWTAQVAHEARLELLRKARNEYGDSGHPERYMKAAVDAARCDWNMKQTANPEEAKNREQLLDPEYVSAQRKAWAKEQGIEIKSDEQSA